MEKGLFELWHWNAGKTEFLTLFRHSPIPASLIFTGRKNKRPILFPKNIFKILRVTYTIKSLKIDSRSLITTFPFTNLLYCNSLSWVDPFSLYSSIDSGLYWSYYISTQSFYLCWLVPRSLSVWILYWSAQNWLDHYLFSGGFSWYTTFSCNFIISLSAVEACHLVFSFLKGTYFDRMNYCIFLVNSNLMQGEIFHFENKIK